METMDLSLIELDALNYFGPQLYTLHKSMYFVCGSVSIFRTPKCASSLWRTPGLTLEMRVNTPSQMLYRIT